VFIALCVIEGLLAARFWIQLAAVHASDGLREWVLDLTHPLVSPFADARDQAQDSVASFERGTLLAGMAYLIGAVVLIVVSLLLSGFLNGREAISIRRRRTALQQFQHPLVTHAGPRLIATAFVGLNASQTTRALRMLRLDQLKTDLHVIPAERGSVIAAFEPADALPSAWRAIKRTTTGGEAACVRRALRALERRFDVKTPAQPIG
jgi:hypothetical protein